MLDTPDQPAAPKDIAPAQPVRLLVVEDDFLIRMMLSEVLADEGFEIVEAETGDAALALLDTGIALLITDVQLPGSLDGQALVAAARLQRPELPVIYTSGRLVGTSAQDTRMMAVSKPYQSSEICAAVRRMLAV